MHTYARIYDGIVVEIINPATDESGNEIPISERFHPVIVAMLVDVTNSAPAPQQYWTYQNGIFEAPTSTTQNPPE